ncbi:beta/gamma crystallin domain-containing protein [Streptomyces sp. NBC_00448]|uniref:beta/gamma crystallin domain-containing protein n=1 Tax=Streptomyces sp. NBC_00448 TaxID=2903652 RepID=UPI002E24AE90
MKKIAKRLLLPMLTALAVGASLTFGATGASAISPVNCGPSDYLTVDWHGWGDGGEACFANAGQIDYFPGSSFVTRISTGNNLVQWYGDGRWQPPTPIGKNTVFTWPNNPGGVNITSIRIL